jgi:23S rRNA (uridine2552-2'-O)-methyltransferase
MVKKRTVRDKTERVKTSKGRKSSSTKWLKRQLNDPYVAKAQMEGYRGRAAFKLIEINEKLDILHPNVMVVDLGAAPGGWCQVAAEKGCKVVGLDLLEMDPIENTTLLQMDFMDDDAPEQLRAAMAEMNDGSEMADLVISDLAPNTIGHKNTDHVRIMALVELAYHFAKEVLKEGGTFIAKVRQGGTNNELLATMKHDFQTTKHIKPPASRKESSETYLIAQGFRGKSK